MLLSLPLQCDTFKCGHGRAFNKSAMLQLCYFFNRINFSFHCRP